MRTQTLKISEAATLLAVSQATVRNWVKAGIIDENLSIQNIEQVKNNINQGIIKRLDKRANKAKSNKTFIPLEYAQNEAILQPLQLLIASLQLHFQSIEMQLAHFVATYYEVLKCNENLPKNMSTIKHIQQNYYSHKIDENFIQNHCEIVKKLYNQNCYDLLGLVYQSIISEGDKSQAGSYYTPLRIIRQLMATLPDDIKTFMDPCCGTGAFLLGASQIKKLNPEHIFGIDIDPNAVFLAKVNVLLAYPQYCEVPNIFCFDTLNNFATGDIFCETNKYNNYFDAIVTNPPWGASKNNVPSPKYEALTKSKEIFAMFVLKAIELLKPNGIFNILLPESILNIQIHKEIRHIICQQTQILSITTFGRAFTGVFTPVVAICANKQMVLPHHLVTIIAEKAIHKIPQKQFIKNKDNIFEIKIQDIIHQVIDKIFQIPHTTLKNNAKWALGIVTGNNDLHLKNAPQDRLEPIFRGSDVNYFRLNNPQNFIFYDRNLFQQVAKDEFYRVKEKLIYKFISKKLVFAYDNHQSLTINSANILIPQIHNLPIKCVLALLNSKVFQFLFTNKFATHKVLRSNLETLPFPLLKESQVQHLTHLTDLAIQGIDNFDEINQFIFNIFCLTKKDIEVILENQ